ncbi:MAG: hypothetical protein ACYCUM_06750 [Solirubrobacteraceae bacterium]
MRPEKSHGIHHRVTLPDGREVEVVYLGGADGEAGQNLALGNAPDLHVCFHCAGVLVHPLDWSDEDADCWRILLRCPECEATREGVFERGEVDALEQELEGGMGSLLSDLRRMTHTNMAEEIEFFVRALEADVIVPSDF